MMPACQTKSLSTDPTELFLTPTEVLIGRTNYLCNPRAMTGTKFRKKRF